MMPASTAITLTYDRLDTLLGRAHPENPKAHDLDAIAASIRRFGYVTPVVVNDRDDRQLEGHGRVEALDRMQAAGESPPAGIRVDGDGMWLVPTIHGFDLSPQQVKAFLVAANRTVELGGWDEGRLTAILTELAASAEGLAGMGFSTADLDALVAGLSPGPAEPAVDPDDAPPRPPRRAVYVRAGDTWALGEHLLACADAREPDVVARLVDGGTASCLLTDPPYGVNYQGGTAARLSIANDDAAGLRRLLDEAFAAVDPVLAPGASIYVFHPAGPLSQEFAAAFTARWQYRQGLVWVKDSLVLGRSDYHYRHEPILYGFKRGSGRFGRGAKGWYGGNDCASVIEVPRPKSSHDHPTAKPVQLIATLLNNSTRRGDTVLDPFLGSGSTLIAAERFGRRCLGIEIDPAYCQVAIERWQRYTGRRAERLER